MRDSQVKFVVNPRARAFGGLVVILVDGMTASCAEILTAGLKDLGRVRVFGSRTAGAALPPTYERLPNGDGFQYAIGSYVSASGASLEGVGVTPDESVVPTRSELMSGTDVVLEAATQWIMEHD